MTTVVPPLCATCKHLAQNDPEQEWTCAAFPKGIPAAILLNSHDHRKPYKGDHGIQYEPLGDGPTYDPFERRGGGAP